MNKPNQTNGGILQPSPGLDYWRRVRVGEIFHEASAYWSNLTGNISVQVPDRRWVESINAIIGHSALCMNQGAPDVAVVNYNVFNRDGVYMANIFQKSGNFGLSEKAIDYFLSHPFNGRVQPEADNPGQILWAMGEHWRFTRNRQWLERVYPAAQQIARMIRYYRTAPEPHWVCDTNLLFGEELPKESRKRLHPGACDGNHPEYTEAFDIAGLRAMAALAEGMNQGREAASWKELADGPLFPKYDSRFGGQLPKDYGSYSVLWPCRLYALHEGKGVEQFRGIGGRNPAGWRYFPLAAAHQGLLAGNRNAGWQTIESHLKHPQMQGWYAFDEGGGSGTGGWNHVRTTWRQGKDSVAMPHGWAIAEFFLLLRDSLAFEDGGRLVLFAGVPPAWFSDTAGMRLDNFPTHFGPLKLAYLPDNGRAELRLAGATPPDGFVLRVAGIGGVQVEASGKALPPQPNGDVVIGPGVEMVLLRMP